MIEFLLINGYDLAIDDAARWADEVIALVEHRTAEEDFVSAVRPFWLNDSLASAGRSVASSRHCSTTTRSR
jgi:hypothetical protein